MLALTPDEDIQISVASVFEGEGYAVIRASIGGDSGVRT